MKKVRHLVPVLSLFALTALFLKLPEIPDFFGFFTCKACSSSDPYLALMGAGYFSALLAVSLLFPAFPLTQVARGGLLWAVLLFATLSYIDLPNLCVACMIAHACNICIWAIWLMTPPSQQELASNLKERLFMALLMPISIVALFSCLNLTFMAYSLKNSGAISATDLKLGDATPIFATQTIDGHLIANTDDSPVTDIILNFVTPDCPYCKEQMLTVNAIASEIVGKAYRMINVSPKISSGWMKESPIVEWIEDKDGQLRQLFKVAGYPTMFVIGSDGKLAQIIAGVPEKLESLLLTNLVKSVNLRSADATLPHEP